jgi:hypothetical protein
MILANIHQGFQAPCCTFVLQIHSVCKIHISTSAAAVFALFTLAQGRL